MYNVIEKCEKKLSRWKCQYLSFAGRLTLIKSVLDNSMLTYMMSPFPIPVGVTQRLDNIRRKFLWQGNKEKKVYNLIKWKEVILSKVQGGLGIRNLKNHNKALRLKWLWRYSQDPETLRSKVIKAKYEVEDNWMTKPVNSAYGVSLWRSIRVLWPALNCKVSIKVQNGSKASFGNDNWLGNGTLKVLFADIFALAQHQ